MARILTAKTRRELLDSTPQPSAWPLCGECGLEFVLRRALTVRTVGKKLDMRVAWVWSRDCKHKSFEKTDKVERARAARKAGRK